MTDSTEEYTRLHITPLSAALLPSILPPSVLPNARNISYHTIQTFPEKLYGFLELPAMDASKLKKKLHGSILKGTKIRIETAKPKPDLTPAEPEPEKPKREKKKRKRDEIPGVEIERSVKRGWTTPGLGKKELKDSKKIKSKYRDGKECLFKTVLPPNVAANDTSEKKKKKRRDRETVVHEFEKSEKFATFLRDPAGKKKAKGVAKFVEGQGWVDEDGTVVEQVTLAPKKTSKSKIAAEVKQNTPEGSSDDSSSDEEVEKIPNAEATEEEASATSTSGSSSDEQSDSSSDEQSDSSDDESDTPEPELLPQKLVTETPLKISRPTSSAGLTISIPNSAISSTPITGQVHPLEALYKRSKADPTAKLAESSFSFFGADDEDDDEDASEARDTVPLTPFTQRDFEYRGLRSAAPTPDTAHGNKRFLWPIDMSDDEEERSSPVPKPEAKQSAKGKGKAKE